ncbi:MAG TPA: DUF5915 domain-containing protein, partial [Herpetosiphonaceae bacterium]|nr:DUF5915 domain-containing protein [Herpetosiphonaceae bacterium]
SFELTVEGETLTLAPDDVLMEANSPEGYAVAESEGVLVALVTATTPELEREGVARELVRVINDARKAANLEITDRITATVQPSGPDHLEPVLAEYGAFIKEETLCDFLHIAAPLPEAYTLKVEFETVMFTDKAFAVGVQKHA